MTNTGLGKGIEEALKDTGFEEQEPERTVTPEQEAKGQEFIRKLEETAIEDEQGQTIIRDMLTLGRFQGWLYQERLTTNDEFKEVIDRSRKWLEARRKFEVEAGILHSESLCWQYSREQIRKIEANPTDDSLYGLTILPHEREKRIRESKQYHEYEDKVKSGYFDRLAAESLRQVRGEVAQSRGQFKEAEF